VPSVSSFMIRPLYVFRYLLCISLFLHFSLICHLFEKKNKAHFPLTSGTFLLFPTHFELCSVTLTLGPSSFRDVVYTQDTTRNNAHQSHLFVGKELKQKMRKSYLRLMRSHLPQYICKSLQPSRVTMAMKRMKPYLLPRDQFSSRDIF
jgi:hypothetical protein